MAITSLPRKILNIFGLSSLLGLPFSNPALAAMTGENKVEKNFYSLSVKKADGTEQSLSDFKNKVVVVVNVASRCGFTPQYEGLEKLYESYKDKGLVVLGFPCNQFGAQEPGSDQEIQSFCKLKYGVSFPIFKKVDVNGDAADPLYKWLKSSAPGFAGTEAIKWNFTKFLINKNGKVVERFAPQTKPEELESHISKLLAESN